MSGRILVVDDDAAMRQMLLEALRKRGFEAAACASAAEADDYLADQDADCVVTDVKMRGGTGIDLCARIQQSRPDLPVIVITAFGCLDSAVAAIRAGAYDFITKPFEIDALRLALDRAVEHRVLKSEVRRLRAEVTRGSYPEIVGTSPAMRRVFDLLDRVGPTDASVLVTGESGTGKEIVARALHRRSARSRGPFVAVNCAAMPEALLESELFGHARGAFTDAHSTRSGLFVNANGGTLFLDEIGELSPALQPKLLRALQERQVRPVGSDQEVPFDARLVTATNRDLERAVEERRFREDLYYRVNVIQLSLPPLRARGNDVLLLAQHFLLQFATSFGKPVAALAPATAARLLRYDWPGNVRELANCIERAVALARGDEIVVDDLPPKVTDRSRRQLGVAGDDPLDIVPLEEIERRHILRVLEAVGGNKTLAAQTLGLDRKTLYRKLERWEAGAGAD